MNSPTHRTSREGIDGNGPEHRLDQLLAHHHTQLTSAVADALDTDTGSAALAPLNRDLFHGLKPLQLPAPSSAQPTPARPNPPCCPRPRAFRTSSPGFATSG